MRIFVTGATGFVGAAVIQNLLTAGHQVLGLARSEAAADKVRAAGAEPHRGALDDLDSLRRGAAAADGVIHTAFIHDDFTNMAAAGVTDHAAIAAIGDALAGSDRPLIVSSAIGLLRVGRTIVETDRLEAHSSYRSASELTALGLAARGVRASVIRLPQVHGDGDYAFVPALIKIAHAKRVSAYLGDGRNRWSAVHRFDAAELYRLAVEAAPAGSVLHAVGEEGIATHDLAAAIGRGLDLPVASKPADEAAAHFGWIARFVAADMAASSTHTRALLGWAPHRKGLLEDLAHGTYFAAYK